MGIINFISMWHQWREFITCAAACAAAACWCMLPPLAAICATAAAAALDTGLPPALWLWANYWKNTTLELCIYIHIYRNKLEQTWLMWFNMATEDGGKAPENNAGWDIIISGAKAGFIPAAAAAACWASSPLCKPDAATCWYWCLSACCA